MNAHLILMGDDTLPMRWSVVLIAGHSSRLASRTRAFLRTAMGRHAVAFACQESEFKAIAAWLEAPSPLSRSAAWDFASRVSDPTMHVECLVAGRKPRTMPFGDVVRALAQGKLP